VTPDATPLATFWSSPRSENKPDKASIRVSALRVESPARHLPAIICSLGRNSLDENRGVAIWSHALDSQSLEAIRELRRRGVRVLIETDTNLLDLQSVQVFGGLLRDKGLAGMARYIHRRCCEEADGALVATPAQVTAYERIGQDRRRQRKWSTYLAPNTIDPAEWPDPVKPNDGVFRIGFAGPGAHRWTDVRLIHDALAWSASQPYVQVVLMGFDARRWAPWLGRAWDFSYSYVPFTRDLSEYRRNLAVLDVGLCPQDPTDALRLYNSDTKALDYAAAGAFPIVSDLEPYRSWEGPASMARDAADFFRLVRWAVDNREEVKRRARQARAYVLAKRTIGANIWRWREACVGAAA
jgi:hypothetical protein